MGIMKRLEKRWGEEVPNVTEQVKVEPVRGPLSPYVIYLLAVLRFGIAFCSIGEA